MWIGRLREGLAASRRRVFVGRAAERELFESGLLADGEPALAVLFVQGPGGVGKSALLRMFAQQAAVAGYWVLRVDGHDVRPNAVSFLDVAGSVVGRDPVVVLVDTYELLEPLDDWLREEFVAGLPAGSKVVNAGRRALPAGWRSDPGWRDLWCGQHDAVVVADDLALVAELDGPAQAARGAAAGTGPRSGDGW